MRRICSPRLCPLGQEAGRPGIGRSRLLTHPEELEAMAEASLDCHRDGARIIGKEIVRLLRPQTAGAATDLIYEH